MRRLPILLVALVALPLLVSSAAGGSYAPPPGDSYPTWSPDGKRIAFLTGRDGNALAVVPVGSPDETRISDALGVGFYPDPTGTVLSPDWQWVALARFDGSSFSLVVRRVGGSDERRVGAIGYGMRPAWSPDSRRIVFRRLDGTLVAQTFDSGVSVEVAPGGTSPAWSPDGRRIAYSGGTPADIDIHVVDVDDRRDVVLAGGAGHQLDPVWSPDGTRVAFLSPAVPGEPYSVAVAAADGSNVRTYETTKAAGPLSWDPNGRGILYAGVEEFGIFRLDLETASTRRLVAFGTEPVLSPDGTQLAFSGGGECRDREGIYVARADGKNARRLTNDCRVLGSPGADVLKGTPLADILVGLGGDDRLVARDPGYVGDTLLGGDGDDVLLGAIRGDILRGGRGDDRLRGGNSQDVLAGGPGRDLLDSQRGADTLYARDGTRDTVRCGTNTRRSSLERDEVWADRFDRIAADCEVVHRSR